MHQFSFGGGGPRVGPRVGQSFALQATRCDAPAARHALDASDRNAFFPLSRSLFILHAVQSTCVHSACIQSTCSIFFTSHTCWVIFSVATCCRLSNSFQVRELARAEEKAALGVGTRDVHVNTSYTMQPRGTSQLIASTQPRTAPLPLRHAGTAGFVDEAQRALPELSRRNELLLYGAARQPSSATESALSRRWMRCQQATRGRTVRCGAGRTTRTAGAVRDRRGGHYRHGKPAGCRRGAVDGTDASHHRGPHGVSTGGCGSVDGLPSDLAQPALPDALRAPLF